MAEEQGIQQKDLAAIAVEMLRGMADKIATNASNGFAGAFVIVPPDGEPHEMLLLNNAQSLVMFWSLVQATAKMAVEAIEEQERGGMMGRR